MGLIKAALGSAQGVLSDQWLEYFYCDALPADVLAVKGKKRTSGRSSNKGSDNIISNGSVLAVADGQCMLIVEQGKIVDLCAEPGEYKYDMSTEASLLDGGKLSDNIKSVFKSLGRRFAFGGEAPKDQRVYYVNTKEMMGNKYGTPSSIPFRVVDQRAGIDMDINIRCFGEYSYKITDPMTFYVNVCGNFSGEFKREEIDSQLKSELLTSLQPAFGRLSEQGIRYSSLTAHTKEFGKAMKEELNAEWTEGRGIEICKIGISSMKADEEQEKELREMQKNAANVDPNLRQAFLASKFGNAMEAAASNSAGSTAGFMGMGMTANFGSAMMNMFGGQQSAQQAAPQQAVQQAAPQQSAAPAADSWTCPSCGQVVTGKFCPECGTKKPEAQAGWTCPSCGTVNKGKFCQNCGTKKPAAAPLYRCDKCGWEPEDPKNPPKFCPNCGDPFGEEDITNK